MSSASRANSRKAIAVTVSKYVGCKSSSPSSSMRSAVSCTSVKSSANCAGLHRLAGDVDALGGFHQVRRSVESRANACGAQSGLDHGAGGTLAVGSGDVNPAARALRIAEGIEQTRDALQAEFGGLDFVAERVQEVDGIGVVHVAEALCSARKIARPATGKQQGSAGDLRVRRATPRRRRAAGACDRITPAIAISPPAAPAHRWPNLKPLANM